MSLSDEDGHRASPAMAADGVYHRETRQLTAHPHAGGVTVASRVVRNAYGQVVAFTATAYARGTPIAVSAAAAGLTVCDVLGHLELHGAPGMCAACGGTVAP